MNANSWEYFVKTTNSDHDVLLQDNSGHFCENVLLAQNQ